MFNNQKAYLDIPTVFGTVRNFSPGTIEGLKDDMKASERAFLKLIRRQ